VLDPSRIVILPKADDSPPVSSDTSRSVGRWFKLSMRRPRPSRHRRGASVFDLNEWRQYQSADFIATRNSLMTAAALAAGAARVPAHIDLARFYLARGFYVEARASSVVLAEMKPRGGRATRCPCCAAPWRPPEVALADLANPTVHQPGFQLWKALAYDRQASGGSRARSQESRVLDRRVAARLSALSSSRRSARARGPRFIPVRAARSNDSTWCVPPDWRRRSGDARAACRGARRDQDALANSPRGPHQQTGHPLSRRARLHALRRSARRSRLRGFARSRDL